MVYANAVPSDIIDYRYGMCTRFKLVGIISSEKEVASMDKVPLRLHRYDQVSY